MELAVASSTSHVSSAGSVIPVCRAVTTLSDAARRATVNDASFYTENEMLRGVPASTLFANRGALLSVSPTVSQYAHSVEGDALYDCSVPVTRIQWFISHSWRDPGLQKYLCILWVCNNPLAMVCANLAAAAWLALVCIGAPSPNYKVFVQNPFGKEQAILSTGPGIHAFLVMYLITLFSGHKLARRFFNPLFFLDKCCICQADPYRKAQGISGLGAFLRCSERMLVLWSPDYFNRLWCSYEIACFLSLRGKHGIDIVPIGFMKLLPLLCILVVSGGIQATTYSLFYWLKTIVDAFTLLMLVYVIFYIEDQNQILQRKIDNFRLADAECYCCSVGHKLPDQRSEIPCDREFVKTNVNEWFAELADQGETDGIQAFERCIHDELRDQNILQVFELEFIVIILQAFMWKWLEIAVLTSSEECGCFPPSLAIIGLSMTLVSLMVTLAFIWSVSPRFLRSHNVRTGRRLYQVSVRLVACFIFSVVMMIGSGILVALWWQRRQTAVLHLYVLIALMFSFASQVKRPFSILLQRYSEILRQLR